MRSTGSSRVRRAGPRAASVLRPASAAAESSNESTLLPHTLPRHAVASRVKAHVTRRPPRMLLVDTKSTDDLTDAKHTSNTRQTHPQVPFTIPRVLNVALHVRNGDICVNCAGLGAGAAAVSMHGRSVLRARCAKRSARCAPPPPRSRGDGGVDHVESAKDDHCSKKVSVVLSEHFGSKKWQFSHRWRRRPRALLGPSTQSAVKRVTTGGDSLFQL